MSTYSNLKIQLIGTGELPGTWGTATNVNWGSTGGGIEQAVVGMATISSGFTGSPLTLTLTLTDTAEAQNARALVLNLTQSLGSAGTLNVPAIQKPYMVINSTGQTVTVKVSGQTGVAVPTGTRTFLYNNGTDVGVFFNYIPSLTLGAALPVASGGTGVQTLGSGVVTWMQTPSSANLAAAVTDETGSGSLVFATSPTLVTPTLGVATATSLNKVTVTAPASSATLTLANGSSLITSGANSLTLTTTGATNVTLPTSGTLATTTGSVASLSFGTTGLTPNSATAGAITVAGTLVPANGGTGVANGANNTITFTGNYSLGLTLSNNTALTLPTTGTVATLAGSETLTNKTISGGSNTLSNIANASLTNSSVTFNGVAVALGASGTITASTTNALTIGTGLSGAAFNGSSPVTIAIDSTVATLTGPQTLINKTINGSNNTITNVSLTSGVTGTLPAGNGGTGITSLGSGIATWLGTPSSANLASAVTDETGTGALVFASSPTLTTPRLAGSSSGYSSFASANSSATNYTITFPAENMTVGYRNIPNVGTKSSSYQLATGDVGKYVQVTSGGSITVPNSTFADGDAITIFNNNSSGMTITLNTTTAFISGSTTAKGGGGTVTLAAYGVVTILFYSATACVLSGSVT